MAATRNCEHPVTNGNPAGSIPSTDLPFEPTCYEVAFTYFYFLSSTATALSAKNRVSPKQFVGSMRCSA